MSVPTGISTFPVELLEKIFYIYVHDLPSSDPSRVDIWSPGLTAVCRHWRTVALSYRELWTVPFLKSTEWTAVMLARSKRAPLRILVGRKEDLDTRRDKYNNFDSFQLCISTAVRNYSRIEELAINTKNVMKYTKMLPTASAASALERLELSSSTENPLPLTHRVKIAAAKLRSITLANIIIPWTSSIYSQNITRLRIMFTTRLFRGSNAGSELDFLAALKRMPALESLTLSEIIVPVISNTRSITNVVSLPRLRNLHLHLRLDSILFITRHVQLPISARALVETDIYGSDVRASNLLEEQQEIFLFVSTHCLADTAIREIIVRAGLDVDPSIFEVRSDHELLLRFKYFGFYDSPQVENLYRPIMDRLHLGGLRKLTFESDITPETCLETFGSLKHLEEITLQRISEPSFILVLKMDVDRGLSDEPIVTRAFPSLRKLSCLGNIYSKELAKIRVEGLLYAVKGRFKQGRRLQELVLGRLYLDSKETEALEQWVDNVIWK